MAYVFSQSPLASVRIFDFNGTDGNTLNLTNINSTISADSLIAGIQQFLDVSGLSQAFDPESVSCSITQTVVED